MTVKNRSKNHHHISVGGVQTICQMTKDVMKESFKSFLPSVNEQATLVEELVVLVGQKWASLIVALSWFKECLPERIDHEHMAQERKKTQKV